MSKRLLVAGTLLGFVGYACVSTRQATQAEDDPRTEVSRPSQTMIEDPIVDAAHGDLTLATLIAVVVQEEIGWNEFAVDHVINPDVQKLAQNTIEERQRLLRDLKTFAPDATQSTYLNKSAKDARALSTDVARTETRASRVQSSQARNGKPQGPEVDRLAKPSKLDRYSAEAARIASYKGSVAAAWWNSTGLQSPVINPPSDNLITNPAGIIPGVTEGGSYDPPLIAIKAPQANSAAAVGLGGLAQAAAGASAIQGSVNTTGAGTGSVGGVTGGTTGAVSSTNASGLMSGPAAGANVQGGGNAGNSPSGLFSGPAAGTQGPQSGFTSSTNPTGLMSGPAAGVQGPQSGNISSQNPTGLLSGPAGGANTNTAVGAAANGPTGLLSGPGAGTQGPQSGTNTSQNPTGLLSGPAAGTQGPQSGNTSSQNPTGLLSGPAAGSNTNTAVGAAANGPTGLLTGPGAGNQGPRSGTTTSQNPTGLMSGPAAGTQGPQSGTNSSQNPTGLFTGPAAGANTNTTIGAAANGPTGLLSGPGAGTQGPQSGTTTSQNPTGLLSGPAAGTQGPQSGNTSSQNPTGLLSGPAAGAGNPSEAGQNAGTNNISTVTNGTPAATGDRVTTDQSSAAQPGTLNGPIVPPLGFINDGAFETTGVEGVAGVSGETSDGGLAVDIPNTTFAPTINSGAQRQGRATNGEGRTRSIAPRRAMATNTEKSAHRDFDIVQVERQLAVQSLAGSKRLIEQKTGREIDRAFLRHELAIQKNLLNKILVFQKFASADLHAVLEKAEDGLTRNLEVTRQLADERPQTLPDPEDRGE